jgi:hypothetical protein
MLLNITIFAALLGLPAPLVWLSSRSVRGGAGAGDAGFATMTSGVEAPGLSAGRQTRRWFGPPVKPAESPLTAPLVP